MEQQCNKRIRRRVGPGTSLYFRETGDDWKVWSLLLKVIYDSLSFTVSMYEKCYINKVWLTDYLGR